MRGVVEKNRIYLHKETGASIILPDFPADDEVLPRHLLAVQAVLNAFGIAPPPELLAKLPRASQVPWQCGHPSTSPDHEQRFKTLLVEFFPPLFLTS